ncbi:hypothetical protein D3C81_498660 [compost metagenome]
MPLWSDAPRIASPGDLNNISEVLGYVKSLANTVALMAKDLEFIVNGNLDVNNISANSITAEKIVAGSVTADKIQAGAVTAEKIDVNELSAISANLGHIVAGLIESIQIFGSYIATRNGGYPRAEMSNSDDLFAVYRDSTNYIKIAPDIFGNPAIRWMKDGVYVGAISTTLGMYEVWGYNNIKLNTNTVRINSWSGLYSEYENKTLHDELNEIFDRLEALEDEMVNKSNVGHTHTVLLPTHNHGNVANTNWGGTFSTSS